MRKCYSLNHVSLANGTQLQHHERHTAPAASACLYTLAYNAVHAEGMLDRPAGAAFVAKADAIGNALERGEIVRAVLDFMGQRVAVTVH